MARPPGKQTISTNSLSPVARGIVESVEEYAPMDVVRKPA